MEPEDSSEMLVNLCRTKGITSPKPQFFIGQTDFSWEIEYVSYTCYSANGMSVIGYLFLGAHPQFFIKGLTLNLNII
jgi:hypothetical protein